MVYQKFNPVYLFFRSLNAGHCEKCAATNIAAAKFCGGCGHRLVSLKPHSLRNRFIYAAYMVILMMAVTWRLVNAESSIKIIENIVITETEGQSSIAIILNRSSAPLADFDVKENRLNLVFPQTVVNNTLLNKAFASENLRLGYFAADKDTQKAVARLFIRRNCLTTVRYDNNRVVISLAAKKTSIKPGKKNKNLINPGDERHSPAVISLQNAPLIPVLKELADGAGIDLVFADNLPASFSIEYEASSPFEAIKAIARSQGLSLVPHNGIWILQPRSRIAQAVIGGEVF